MLEVKQLTGGYEASKPINQDVSFTVKPQEMVGLIGLNGAGKSTTIKQVLGLLEPFSGTITINGHSLQEHKVEFRSQIAYIPETPDLYAELTLWEHLQLTAMVYSLPEETFEKRVHPLLERFRMSDKVHQFPHTFSKGMQQKVMILCAFLACPPLFIIDEPFVGLDALAIQELLDLMLDMRNQGSGILLSTHILGMAEKYCDRFVLLHQGRVTLHGTLEEMRAQADKPRATLDELFLGVVRG